MNSEFEHQLQRQPMRKIPSQWRDQILAATEAKPSRWRELFWPAPKAWATLAAAWVLIFALHLSTPDDGIRTEPSRATPSESFAAWQQQQLMMARLLAPVESDDRPPALPAPPKPQSQRDRHQSIG